MAFDIFLQIDTINGESHDKDHQGWIDVLAWSWGASNSANTQQGGGGGQGKVNVNALSITKPVDISTPKLFQSVASGQPYNTAKLVVRKQAGGQPLEYVTINMGEVIVSSISEGGSGGGDSLTENISLNFSKVDIKYIQQNADGSAGTTLELGWDVLANQAWTAG